MKAKFYSLGLALVVFLFAGLQLSAQTPTITLLQPTDPGIEWTAGGTYVISWVDNFPHGVDILLTDDNGTTFDTIEKNVLGSVYYWNTTGYALGTHYKIKVESTLANSYSDMSGHTFKLVDQTNGYITMEQPTGGETWSESQQYLISWNDNLTAPVMVELLKNNAPIDTLAASTTGSTIYWTIPTGLAASGYIYKIRVSSTVSGATTTPAVSSGFKIIASSATYVEVYQPNGGESWARGSVHVVSWNDDLTEPVNIELWKGGTKYTDLATNVTGTTYYWTISDTTDAATNYRIFVRSTLDPTHVYDRSNGYFKITASTGTYVEVYQPNGGERWARGTTHKISWNDDVFEPVYIQLYNSSTHTYTTLDTNVMGTTWDWNIDNTISTTGYYYIYVRSTLDPTHVYDRSNGHFRITASTGTYVEVYQPNGGESWARGTAHLISWNDDIFEPVYIQLYNASTHTYTTLDTNVVGTTWVWNIDNSLATGSYRIYVKSTLDPTHVYDYGGTFHITASTGTYVEVYQPNGGESWARGTSHLISWNCDFPEGVNIILKQGSTIVDTIGLDLPKSTIVWDIPSTEPTASNYKIEIYSTLDSLHLHDYSDGNFSITASTGTFVEVLEPNGGEVWAAGTSYWISWNDDFTEGVNIELWKNGVYDSNIATDVLGSAYSWAIPVTQDPNTHYKVEVYSTLDSLNLHDFSDGYFEIVPQTMMSVYPNPADNHVTINMENMRNNSSYTLQLFDRFNKPVIELQTNSKTTTLSTTGLSDGIYFVVATSDKNRVTKKVIIQH